MTINWKTKASRTGMVVLALALAGCGGSKAPEPQPEPEPQPQAEQPTVDEEAQRAAAEEARQRQMEEEKARRIAAQRQRVQSILVERVHFDFDRSDIRPDDEEILQRKVSVLREFPDLTIRIAGNCDERGSIEYNLALGMRRAEAVKRYLMSYGLEASRFTTISYGKERPLVQESNEEAWAQNRRDDFAIVDWGQLGAGN